MTRSGKTARSVSSTGDDDFFMVTEPEPESQATFELPIRANPTSNTQHGISVEVQALQQSNHLTVSIQPPKQPEQDLERAPCDIVLVIDVSGSMNDAAPQPDVKDPIESQAAGLSVLDLAKHAARTVLETLKADDRLAIVTFSHDATIVQGLLPMTHDHKRDTAKRITSIRTGSYTNLWAGIRAGLKVFEKTKHVGNFQGLYVLTDGMPNHMCPQQGYVAKLGPMLSSLSTKIPTVPTIHTFGFGYGIRSALMQSIAEIGNGSYSFIPDVGMIGTVFVHAVANLFTTFATSAMVEVTVPDNMAVESIGLQDFVIPNSTGTSYALRLGNIHYGQTRDLVFAQSGHGALPQGKPISVTLKYKLSTGVEYSIDSGLTLSSATPGLDRRTSEYRLFRARMCALLCTLFPLKQNGEHGHIIEPEKLDNAGMSLSALARDIRAALANGNGADERLSSILQDLEGDEPAGQVTKALTNSPRRPYWTRWGHRYLPSFLHAHQRQLCNTFKDPGPLVYSTTSPLFIKYRRELDSAFDNLPPPQPSRPERVVPVYDEHGEMTGTRSVPHSRVASMRTWNKSDTPCFPGHCQVKLGGPEDGDMKAWDVVPGTTVWTPVGPRKVHSVVKTELVEPVAICKFAGGLQITEWHPLLHEGTWVFPHDVATFTTHTKDNVYSFLLEPDDNPDAHAVKVRGRICVTLGHGVVGGGSGDDDGDDNGRVDARSHPFFGDWDKVSTSLDKLNKDEGGRCVCAGLERDDLTGLACGFTGPTEPEGLEGQAEAEDTVG
ncbi:hypothetical protein PV08_01891 [Exophiala spinifera]|uniref:VWFA domain-containing protein n=1 Tax=Exophiala spinifera TaxID=91928 RepID=A0A0D1Z0Y3_9EURO|nr:uncharacterized protein PV08_01891 [Exophiala spinifera]KIW21311.1 hypothetical protein PV08_01891 [Exophiala spinifera]